MIPIVASFGLIPNALTVILRDAGACGGPFVPPVITLMGITRLTYGVYLANISIPVTILVFIITYYTGKKCKNSMKELKCIQQET